MTGYALAFVAGMVTMTGLFVLAINYGEWLFALATTFWLDSEPKRRR